MAYGDKRVRKAGRQLMYFGEVPERPDDYPDRRQLARVQVQSQARWDQLLGEWVIIASHRQNRTFRPAADQCPLCPSTADSLTEIPAPGYEVIVIENRFPTLGTRQDDDSGNGSSRQAAGIPAAGPGTLLASRPAGSESGMGAFATDVIPEEAAARLRDLG